MVLRGIKASAVRPRPELESDLRLISRIRDGDRDAFAALYRAYEVKLGRFLLHLVRQPQIAEEVLDDTLLVVWERSAGFRGRSRLSTWIFAIAYRKAMKALRRHDAPVEDRFEAERESHETNPEEAFGQVKLHALLWNAMSRLSPEHRAVVELTYYQDLSYREIAEVMGCPVDTVKTRMFYARRHLRRVLGGEFPDWI